MKISSWLPVLMASLFPILIPIGHILVLWHFWADYSRKVERGNCTCDCWDTVFKGIYESGVARYKHLYFNATENVTKIWVLTVVVIIALYECTKHLIKLMFAKSVRYSMVFLFCLSIFPHYYAWWAVVNYYNDDFFSQWNHQMFFTITELISTIVVVHLADSKNKVTSRKALCISGIAVLHIIAAGIDQFVENIFLGRGLLHQVVRDIGFMVPDLFHLSIPLWLLWKARREDDFTKPFYRDQKLKRDFIGATIMVILLLLLCRLL